jgi:glycosyltransferase involved in cell wall biosynthesis
MADRPLLSIVIPTRNRQRYALSAVEAILGSIGDRVELVVQDNSDSDNLVGMLEPFRDDSRLRFEHLSRTASPVENFDIAVQRATGEYVCAIGDDDVINPEILDACEWALANDIDAIVTDRHRALYFWPDFRAADTGASEAGSLRIYEFSGAVEPVDPEVELRKCALTAGTSLQRLPKVYLGIVRRMSLEGAYARVAQSQVGTCPDMYYAVAAASFTKRVVMIDYPLVIPGASAPSAAGAVRMRKHEGPLESAPHFRARPDYVWSSLIPRFYSVHTFYAESALLAMRAAGRSDVAERFNLPFLYAVTAASYPEYSRQILDSVRFARQSRGAGYAAFAVRCMRDLAAVGTMLARKRLAARSLRPGVTPVDAVLSDLPDSLAATRALAKHLGSRGRSLREALAAVTPPT